jgi:hypothetical protein
MPVTLMDRPGLYRVDDDRTGTHGFKVHLQRRRQRFTRLFIDGTHGSREQAHEAARVYRDGLLQAHPGLRRNEYASILRKNNTSGVPGVCKVEKDRYWVAFWPASPGKPRTAKFSIAKYGEARAFELAVAARQRALEKLDEPFTRRLGKAQPSRRSAGTPYPDRRIQRVSVQHYRLRVALHDGRIIAVPLGWFPALHQASPEDRQTWALADTGEAITWSRLGLTVSVMELLKTA